MFNSDAHYISGVLAQFNINLALSMPAKKRELKNDSRYLSAGDIFCAVNGTRLQGKAYIKDALAANCALIIVETNDVNAHGKVTHEYNQAGEQVVIVAFYQLNQQLFALAKAFYRAPQNKLTMIGVTGTNGKTSTSQLVAQLLDLLNEQTSVIGTNGAGKVNALTAINNTTPGATELHSLLQQFVENEQATVAMEVSSHALEQGRVNAELFDIAIFTNLSRDHLDYHGTMEAYAQAKAKLFAQDGKQLAVLNADDVTVQQWLAQGLFKQSAIIYGRQNTTNHFPKFVFANDVCATPQGIVFTLETHLGSVNIQSPLLGLFNVDNLLAAISVLVFKGFSLTNIAEAVRQLVPVKGRMETFHQQGKALAVVDYAHTPDALENALTACREHCAGELWAVFGCGGDRDKGKRSLMGKVADKLSDNIVLTNDNPRSEQPEAIISDILSGCIQQQKVTVMLDRQQAVLHALSKAKDNDVVLFAGKGHEDYVEVQGERHYYNEREWVSSQYNTGITQ